jgi:phage shock protein A
MFNRITSMLEEDDEPPSRVEQIIEEIKQGIEALTAQIKAIELTASNNNNKLLKLREQNTTIKEQAKQAYTKQETLKAQSLWEELKVVEHKINQYQDLQASIDQSRIKLQKQRNELEFKRDQLLAKVKVGELDANASKNYADIMESLMLLKHSGELTQYSEAIEASEYKTEALKELSDEPFSTVPTGELDDLEHLIEVEKKSNDQKAIDQLQKKYGDFFDNSSADEPISRKEERLKALATQAVAPTKADKFFDKEDEVPKSSEQADRIKNFFGK